MSLILPPWYFADETDNITATITCTQCTSGASVNTDGSWASLLGALAHDVHYLTLAFQGNISGAATIGCALVDIGADPAGGTNYSEIISDLLVSSNAQGATHKPYQYGFAFPLYIKSGSTLGVRARAAVASRVLNVRVWAFGNPTHPEMWWCGSNVETLGATPASSRGTTITPGVSSAWGSWTNIPSSGTTSGRYGAIQVGYGGENTTAMQLQYSYVRVGYSNADLPGCPYWHIESNTSEQAFFQVAGQPIWCDIPVGTQMQAAAACSQPSGVDTLEVTIYGVY